MTLLVRRARSGETREPSLCSTATLTKQQAIGFYDLSGHCECYCGLRFALFGWWYGFWWYGFLCTRINEGVVKAKRCKDVIYPKRSKRRDGGSSTGELTGALQCVGKVDAFDLVTG
jgi:hypothetical protein